MLGGGSDATRDLSEDVVDVIPSPLRPGRPHHVLHLLSGCHLLGRAAVGGLDVRVHPAGQQHLDELEPSLGRREHQRRASRRIRSIRIGAGIEQQLDDLGLCVALFCEMGMQAWSRRAERLLDQRHPASGDTPAPAAPPSLCIESTNEYESGPGTAHRHA